MDFFNKLSKKTNEVYKGAKEKTVKISEEIKLKNKISEMKDKIKKEYLEIGKEVYSKVSNGEDVSKEDIAPRCDEISRLNDEIKKIETSILALKNIKKCVNCGENLEANDEFCSKCGTAQPKVEEVKVEVTEEEPTEVEEVEVTEVKDAEEKEEKKDKKEE